MLDHQDPELNSEIDEYQPPPKKTKNPFRMKIPKTNLGNVIILFSCVGCALLVLFVVLIMFIVAIVPPEQKDKLSELYDTEWSYRLKTTPEFSSLIQDGRFQNTWSNYSLESIQSKTKMYKSFLDQIKYLRRFDKKYDPLTSKNAKLFEAVIQKRFDFYNSNFEFLSLGSIEGIMQDAGPHITVPELIEHTPFLTITDYNDYLTRLNTMDTYINLRIDLLRQGLKQKITKPLRAVSQIPMQIQQLISPVLESTVFFGPFTRFPASILQVDRNELIRRAKESISNVVIPSFVGFSTFLTFEYIPNCSTSDSILALEKGKDMYRMLIKSMVMSGKTPDQIHDIGIAEVARLRAEMKQIITELGFNGRFYDFLQTIRNDTRFYAKTEEEFLDFVRGIAKRADPELPKVISKLPRCTYGIKPIEAYKAPTEPNAKYVAPSSDCRRPGYYYINTYDLNSRPKYQYEGIVLHGIGHHLLSASSAEMNFPLFRLVDSGLTGDFVSYGEGWALYTESLGESMGFYTNPYYKFGMLGQEMMRAVRVVVDTGIHWKGWTRDQAINYTSTLTPLSDAQVETEVDRVISWPAQYLTHTLGVVRIKALREKAKQDLKDKFDLREFNTEILNIGPTTLPGLEEAILQFIERKK